jgi:tumor protein p53-inducible protein 3
MKAVLIEENTKRLYIGETEEPVLGEDELLVDVRASALNRADLLQRRGFYSPPAGASPILGLEMAGVISAVGKNVDNFKKGEKVFGLLPGGGYAERVAIPAKMAMRIPENLSFEEAAAIPEVFLTAYLNLFFLGHLQPEQTVLIHAGASGVGTAAIQLVREAGASSIVTAGTEQKRQTCLDLGALSAIDYKSGPFASSVKEITGGRGVNIILDFIGASYWEQNIESLAIEGKLILVGMLGGAKVENVNLNVLRSRRLQILGTTLRTRSLEEKIKLTKAFAEFSLTRFADGRLKPIIDKVYDWNEVNAAHEQMENNQNIGKIVLQMDHN